MATETAVTFVLLCNHIRLDTLKKLSRLMLLFFKEEEKKVNFLLLGVFFILSL